NEWKNEDPGPVLRKAPALAKLGNHTASADAVNDPWLSNRPLPSSSLTLLQVARPALCSVRSSVTPAGMVSSPPTAIVVAPVPRMLPLCQSRVPPTVRSPEPSISPKRVRFLSIVDADAIVSVLLPLTLRLPAQARLRTD